MENMLHLLPSCNGKLVEVHPLEPSVIGLSDVASLVE